MKSVLQFFGGVVGFVASNAGLLGFLPHSVQVVIGGASTVLTVLGIRNASQAPPDAAQILDHLGSGWKTATGIVFWFIGTMGSDPSVTALLPPWLTHILTTGGAVLTALGLYHARTPKAG